MTFKPHFSPLAKNFFNTPIRCSPNVHTNLMQGIHYSNSSSRVERERGRPWNRDERTKGVLLLKKASLRDSSCDCRFHPPSSSSGGSAACDTRERALLKALQRPSTFNQMSWENFGSVAAELNGFKLVNFASLFLSCILFCKHDDGYY